MGGDHAPSETVRGAVQFASTGQAYILLVGDPEALQAELANYDASRLPIRVIPSEGVVREDEQPALALRQKPRASILVSTGLVKRGMADACVTAGSTGAAMAAAAVVLGLAKGVERPALGGPVVGIASETCILDLGANVDCRPRQLLSFGAIGDVFARSFWGHQNPRVALLSVGAEAGKGNRQVSETTEMFERSGLNFIGNIEANDVPNGAAEVVVCDGFVGNIVMKLTEGLGQRLTERLRESLSGKLPEADMNALLDDFYEINNVVETRGGRAPARGERGERGRAWLGSRGLGGARYRHGETVIGYRLHPANEPATGRAGIAARSVAAHPVPAKIRSEHTFYRLAGGILDKSDISGKFALVTGASKGIGKASALRLGELGVNVAVNYNSSQSEAEDTVERLAAMGVDAFMVKADVSSHEEVSGMVDEATERFGQIDILVNNAGIISDSLLIRMSDKAWDDVIATNLNGDVLLREGGLARDDTAEVGTHHQHRVGGRDTRQHRAGELLGVEGGNHRLHQGAGERGRLPQHNGEHRHPRVHQHGHG